ncbi:hypothetical protein C2I33_21720 [Ralstonia solanacearum]|nr:hypothetical protein C2I33_21720 [Ralstonia solanacearum]
MTQDPGGSDLLRRNTERRVRIRSALTHRGSACRSAASCRALRGSGGLCFESRVVQLPGHLEGQVVAPVKPFS